MQQLEENVRKEQMKEKAETLIKELISRVEAVHIGLQKSFRASILTIITWVAWIGTSLTMAFTGIENTRILGDTATNWLMVVFIFTFIREMWVDIKTADKVGALRGFEDALIVLGYMTKEDVHDGRKKRRNRLFTSPFKRFKELFERINSNQTKEVPA